MTRPAWSGWVYEFRIEAARCFRQVAANRHDQPISDSDIQLLAAQAASKELSEKQRLTIEKSLQSKVHGSGDAPMDVDAPSKTKGGKKGGKGKDVWSKPKKFDLMAIVSGLAHTAI